MELGLVKRHDSICRDNAQIQTRRTGQTGQAGQAGQAGEAAAGHKAHRESNDVVCPSETDMCINQHATATTRALDGRCNETVTTRIVKRVRGLM